MMILEIKRHIGQQMNEKEEMRDIEMGRNKRRIGL